MTILKTGYIGKSDITKRLTTFLTAVLTISAAVLMIVFSKEVSEAVGASVERCLTVIIPSLYPFMVLSGFMINSGIYELIGLPFYPVAKFIFRMPTGFFSVFMISMVAGYPVGAKLITDMVQSKKISAPDAERMYNICYGGGPAFVTGMAGIYLFGDSGVGMTVFLSVLTANVIAAVLSGLIYKSEPVGVHVVGKSKQGSDVLIRSISSGAGSLSMICAIIVFCSALIAVFDALGAFHAVGDILSRLFGIDSDTACILLHSFMEISNITVLPRDCYSLLPSIAALMSFGGLCVLLQVYAVSKGGIRLFPFLFTRAVSAAMSYLICKAAMVLFPMEICTMKHVETEVGIRHISPIATVFLLIMTILLLSKKNDSI